MLARTHQRKTARASFPQKVLLWRGREAIALDARDISAGGVFVKDGGALQARALLTLRVNIPGHKGFTVVGRVSHAQRGQADGVGVEFLDLMPGQRRAVEAYVAGASAA